MHIHRMLRKHGTKWSQILKGLPEDRTVSSVRNRYQRMQKNTGTNLCKRCGQIKRGHSCTGGGEIVQMVTPDSENDEGTDEGDKSDDDTVGGDASDEEDQQKLYHEIEEMIEEMPHIFEVSSDVLSVTLGHNPVMTIIQSASSVYESLAYVKYAFSTERWAEDGPLALSRLGESLMAFFLLQINTDVAYQQMTFVIDNSITLALGALVYQFEQSLPINY